MIYNLVTPVYIDGRYGLAIEFRQGPAITATNDEDAIKFAKKLGVANPIVELVGERKVKLNDYEKRMMK